MSVLQTTEQPQPIHEQPSSKFGTLLPPRKFPPNSKLASIQDGIKSNSLTHDVNAEQAPNSTYSADIHKSIIKLPEGVMLNEWLAVKLVDFFNELNVLVSCVKEVCTCTSMSAGELFEYAWADPFRKPSMKPIRLAAIVYMETLLKWVDGYISNPSFMPTEDKVPFPKNFEETVGLFFRRMFRIYAHIYYTHFSDFEHEGVDRHLNHSFKHFAFFALEYGLCSMDDMKPLNELINQWIDQVQS